MLDSKKRAIAAWRETHPDNVRYINYRSRAKNYIKNDLKADEIKKIETYIKARRELLTNDNYVRNHIVHYDDLDAAKAGYYFKVSDQGSELIKHIVNQLSANNEH